MQFQMFQHEESPLDEEVEGLVDENMELLQLFPPLPRREVTLVSHEREILDKKVDGLIQV